MSANLPIVHAERLIERTEARRKRASEALDIKHRAAWGQFFTPTPVAAFLADLIELPAEGTIRILDPGAGVGSLCAALTARAIRRPPGCSMHLVAFEADPALSEALAMTLRDCERAAYAAGVRVTTDAREQDFLEWASRSVRGSVWAPPETFEACVMNPPYRKINGGSAHRVALARIGLQVTNLYTAFMGVTACLLEPAGQLSAITPRSFANGPYFRPFRDFFLSRMALDHLHVYQQRDRVFADAHVLQENVVLRAIRGERRDTVTLSVSSGYDDPAMSRRVSHEVVVHPGDAQRFIRIPVDDHASQIASMIGRLPAGLGDLGLTVSTGRVVDFRTRQNLIADPVPGAAALIYPTHMRSGRVTWPILGGRKPNALAIGDDTVRLLLPMGEYTLVKRFSAKEERRRVTASWFRCTDVQGGVVGFENHLNVFHCDGEGIEPALAAGLTVFLNTSTVDAYVRQFSGHTQINATDLRLLRYPDRETLLGLGAAAEQNGWPSSQEAIDALAQTFVVGFRDGAQVVQAA